MMSLRTLLIIVLLLNTQLSSHILGVEGFLLPSNRSQWSHGLNLSKYTHPLTRELNRKDTSTCLSNNEPISNYGEDCQQRRVKGSKITTEVKAGTLNLIKAMAGTGILALPMGVAKVSDFKSSIFPASALMFILGGVSTYTFMLYGRLIHASQARTLGELWEKNMDKSTAWIVSAVSLIFCIGACLSYSLCLGDVSSSLAQTFGWNGVWASRQFWIIMLTTIVLYPLCNLKSLIALAPFSLAGVTAVLITTLFIAWRCPLVNAKSPYSMQGGAQLLSTLSLQQLPKFQTMNKGFLNPSSLILFGMAASAYLGHFTVADLYHSLTKEKTKSGEKRLRIGDDHARPEKVSVDADRDEALNSFFVVSLGGFVTVTMINCLVMAYGFLTFGGNSMGVILNNFSTMDTGATICRLLTAISVLGGYPFLISACRGEILELWKLRTNHTPERKDENLITVTLLVALTVASMIISDAGLIIGLAGAIMGSALVYIFPSLLFLATTKRAGRPKSRMIKLERMFCRFLVAFGSFAAFAGIASILS